MNIAAAIELNDALVLAVEQATRYTVRVDGRGRLAASGMLWGDDIVVATEHTLEREDDITITLPDGATVRATIAGRDPGSDLAVLRLPSGAASAAPARAGQPKVGSLVLALGRPHEIGASVGIVSAIGGPWRSRSGSTIAGLIRPDLTMYPGFSGGPLVDIHGAVLGINTSGLRGGALTIPLDAATTVVEQLLAHGRLKRGYLGLTSQPVRLPHASNTNQQTGLLVVGIEPASPSERAGLFIGDILLALGEEPLRDTDDLRAALRTDRSGQPTDVQILRGGVPQTLLVTIGER
jgi:S1-C subfamily serine protease